MNKIFLFTAFLFIGVFPFSLTAQTYEQLAERAMEYLETNDYPAAEITLKEALRKEPANPGNTLLLNNLGGIQRALGKYEDAVISYSAALVKHPDALFVLHNRAALYCEMDSLEAAKKDYSLILLRDSKNVEALYRQGLIYMNEMDYENAERNFNTITLNDPDDPQGKIGIAMLLKRQERWEEAEELYTDLIYKDRTNGELYMHRAECYLMLKKLARTQEDINQAIKHGNETPTVYIIRGQLKVAQYDKFAAKADFVKAKELGADEKAIEELLKFCK